ncbi:MAG TPA: aldehyde ferredoxin oxidoreductase C-terminal domain-containing protein, partial [Desulfomonilaceae bacterium]|nr:aldehyde ferredoxin oxidoreductase C-terminal domain-containing protein [Desulfomonilaceae bacterium]
MRKLIRVDMSQGKLRYEDLAGEYERLGGRGLTSCIVAREVPPQCHALGPENKLIIASGLLSGTTCANSGRLSVGAKSPLTGGIKESNVGGTASFKLGRLNIAGIVFEQSPPAGKLFYLFVDKDGAKLLPADDLKGLNNFELCERLKAKHGDKVGVVSIGSAGEMLMSSASVAVTDTMGLPARHAGRGGVGAVMGSKGVKAIVIDDKGTSGVAYHDAEAFKASSAIFRDALREHPVTKPGGGLAVYGTNVLVNLINEAGGFPTRNFSEGQFEGAQKISGETMHDIIKERDGSTTHSACTTCIIQCSNVYNDKDKKYLTSGFEYETIWANGANCGIDDLDAIAKISYLCDDYGLDTIEVGCAVAVAMYAGVKKFGDAEGAIELVHEIGSGTYLGRILGGGAALTGQALGVDQVPVVKRQGLPAYDPRAVMGVGVTYATSPMGADHTAGYAVATNIMKVGGYVDPLKPEGQVDLSRNLQIATAAVDSAGLCVFTAFAILDISSGLEAIPKMLNAVYGWNMRLDDVVEFGKQVLRVEREFNHAAGLGAADDRLPYFFKTKPLKPHNIVF